MTMTSADIEPRPTRVAPQPEEAPTLSTEEIVERASSPGGPLFEFAQAEVAVEQEAEAAQRAEAAIQADAALSEAAALYLKDRDSQWRLLQKLPAATDRKLASRAAYKEAQRAAKAAGVVEEEPVLEFAILANRTSNYEIRSTLREIVSAFKRAL